MNESTISICDICGNRDKKCNTCYGGINYVSCETVATDEQNATSTTSETVVQNATSEHPTIKDSGERRQFDSGAVRDIQTGKGRCDLMPLRQIANFMHDDVIYFIDFYRRTGDTSNINAAIIAFCDLNNMSRAHAMLELSKHFEQGAIKYGERNWEKGLPESCYIDSAVRHYLKFLDGQTDEPHDRAVLWNLMCLWWTHENITTGGDTK